MKNTHLKKILENHPSRFASNWSQIEQSEHVNESKNKTSVFAEFTEKNE